MINLMKLELQKVKARYYVVGILLIIVGLLFLQIHPCMHQYKIHLKIPIVIF